MKEKLTSIIREGSFLPYFDKTYDTCRLAKIKIHIFLLLVEILYRGYRFALKFASQLIKKYMYPYFSLY